MTATLPDPRLATPDAATTAYDDARTHHLTLTGHHR